MLKCQSFQDMFQQMFYVPWNNDSPAPPFLKAAVSHWLHLNFSTCISLGVDHHLHHPDGHVSHQCLHHQLYHQDHYHNQPNLTSMSGHFSTTNGTFDTFHGPIVLTTDFTIFCQSPFLPRRKKVKIENQMHIGQNQNSSTWSEASWFELWFWVPSWCWNGTSNWDIFLHLPFLNIFIAETPTRNWWRHQFYCKGML